jgi:multidrug efflux system membrane fusion protein
MTMSRIFAVILVLVAVGWIGSGVLGRDHPTTDGRVGQQRVDEKPRFKVAVLPVAVEQHARSIVISGRTEADRRATAIARAAGIIVDLRVRRGSVVKTGDIIAVLSDEAREAMVEQAKARLDQRRAELTARMQLIEKGNMPSINRSQLEAEMKGAEALLAQAEAERRKGEVLAPVSGVVNDVPTELGQAMQANATVAEVIALDPMLAVVEVSERQLGGVKLREQAAVKLVTGETATGRVRFVSRKASPQTRTYRVEVRIDNPNATIPDGVTCEVTLPLAPIAAARVPRSALSFSAEGKLGVRTVEEGGRVAFLPIAMVEDGPQFIWVSGVSDGAKVIVQGQEFVKEGERVEAVAATQAAAN